MYEAKLNEFKLELSKSVKMYQIEIKINQNLTNYILENLELDNHLGEVLLYINIACIVHTHQLTGIISIPYLMSICCL